MATTVYYCPVIGCDWEHVEDLTLPDPIESQRSDTVNPITYVQVGRNLTETVLSTHVLQEHTVWDFLNTARSYQTFMKALGGILRDVPDTWPQDDQLLANSMRARRRLADEIERTIHAWQKENDAR